jgi:hypothetical protein
MSDGGLPPDFALMRAVEILARIAEQQMNAAKILPPPIDKPIVLFNEHVMFVTGKTQRSAVVAALGPGYGFPAAGWDTYAMRENNTRYLLSALYDEAGVLAGVDYYLPRASSVPELRPRDFGAFRLVPGQIAMGSDLVRLDDRFVAVAEGPDRRTYSHTFQVRYPGGVAFAQGTGGSIQRFVLFAVAAT